MNTDSMRDTIIKNYHLEPLSAESQNKMIEQISALIFQGVLIRVVPQLSEAKQNELEALLEKSTTPEDMLDFLNENIPGFPGIVAEEAENLKKDSQALLNKLG